MWQQKLYGTKKGGGNGLVAVAIDKERGSQIALKWALDNSLLPKGQTVILIHVLNRQGQGIPFEVASKQQHDKWTKDLFLSFHCYCTRKDVYCLDVLLEDNDVAKALTEYASYAAIDTLVLGQSRHGFIRKFKADIPTSVSKGAPDFCTVYVISKGKVSSVRNASRAAPLNSPLLTQLHSRTPTSVSNDDFSDTSSRLSISSSTRGSSVKSRASVDESFKSPFGKGGRGYNYKPFGDFMETDTDISFISSGRPSTDRTSSAYEFSDAGPARLSTSSDASFGSIRSGQRFPDLSSLNEFTSFTESARTSISSSSNAAPVDDVEAEVRRLKLELKQTMDMYSTACKEALTAKQKATELSQRRLEEERRLEEAKLSEEAAISLAEKERAKCLAAMEAAEAAKKIADLEAQRRLTAEVKALKEAEEMKKFMDSLVQNDIRYRKYSIEEVEQATERFNEERKIGEGGYGPVYKCYLDHTPVAVKVLRPDAAQGREQFQREIEVLSCIRHPNMVLLLGACPEYGILVYEYMARGSLDDCLFRKGNSPVLSWQLRFRIAAEISTGLLFLHQKKPEPLVHRDLKPGNILLDTNYTSKISDVGLAKLVPAVAENVTQCRMTSTAGTFCYIDPEYQQTGMLGVKSDVYSLGIILLQLVTAKSPMGLAHQVEQALENDRFKDILDPDVPDWPAEETLLFTKLALQCAELRRKDRPDLGKVVVPELKKLRELAEESLNHMMFPGGASLTHVPSDASIRHEAVSDSQVANSVGSQSQSSTSSQREE